MLVQVLWNTPERNARAGYSRRRRFRGNAVVHWVNGYRIAAHYGQEKVDLTVTRTDDHITIPDSSGVDWIKAEREVFHRLRRANFHVEPMGGEGTLGDAMSGHSLASSLTWITTKKIHVSIAVRRRGAPPNQHGFYNN